MEVCTRLESVVRDIYIRHGWQHSLRMGPVGYFSTLVEFVFVGFMQRLDVKL
jgi:hypothetical protein